MQMSKLQGTAARRRTGVLLALSTALISGVAVFVNGYGVRAWAGTADATTYTTFKNVVAAVTILAVGVIAASRGSSDAPRRPSGRWEWVGLSLVAVLGGALAFALFFEGLARASSVQAAFIHKTLIVWVGILAVGLLREKVGVMHIAAIALLIAGQLLLAGGLSEVGFGAGEAMILAATLLWSIEIVIAKRLLATTSSVTVGIARMAGGSLVLVAYGVLFGGFAAMTTVSAGQLAWILATGVVLAAYVVTWYAALARAQAIDVTAILVGGAVITAALQSVVRGAPLGSVAGLGLITAGVVLVVVTTVVVPHRGLDTVDPVT
jgi:drug/metabolite transporter (DMT)-like permease